MKKSSCFKLMLSMVMIFIASLGVNAQNYHSKPTAITNLADESKYLSATFATLEDSDNNAFLRNKEKQRIIKMILRSLKMGATVKNAVESNLPTDDFAQVSIAVQSVPLANGEKSVVNWIRSEVLELVSY